MLKAHRDPPGRRSETFGLRVVSWGSRGEERAGLLVGELIIDLNRADGGLPSDPRDLFAGWERLAPRLRELDADSAPAAAKQKRAEVRLGAPSPRPGEIVCLAGNYEEHVREGRCVREFKKVDHPKLFSKAGVTASGPADEIVYPPSVEKLDYEVELAVVMGRPCRNVAAADAPGYVAGYCVLNDVSARCAQFSDGQFFRGKSFEGFCPMGPALVTPDEAGEVGALRLVSRVNGEVRQDSGTDHMTFPVPEIVEFVSGVFTLMPGDVIATGTPAGVGAFMEPPGLLKPGDLVEVEVQGLGRLANRVVAAGEGVR
jgi:2-keto-4-pentenoate hydratase/2-oxohepta-3-ene-1,7-dioic acid hydratase in catechol pathway